MTTGTSAITTCAPLTYKEVGYPAPNNKIANNVKTIDALGSGFPILSPLINLTNFFVLNINVTNKDIQKNKTIKEMNVTISASVRSEEHTSELQSRFDIVCRLLLEIKTRSNKKPARV